LICAWTLCAVAIADAIGDQKPAASAIRSETVIVGRSVAGRAIEMETFGGGERRVLVLGGMHGDEPEGSALARRLADLLRENSEQLDGVTVAIVAEVNPDGLHAGTRLNARKVDLNRNFPASDWSPSVGRRNRHGAEPASEPETRAVIAAIDRIQPDRIVDIHSISARRECTNYDGPGDELASVMSGFNGYPVEPNIGYPTPGCLGSWTGADGGIPTITLELPRAVGAATCWRQNREALLAFVEGFPVDRSDDEAALLLTNEPARVAAGQ
jgi:hypothetical protein